MMQTDQNQTSTSTALRRTRARLLAMGSAAAILVVGLGAFALLPGARPTRISDANSRPAQLAAATQRGATPRMLEISSPFSFADLVERVSPAVVTITSETMTTDTDSNDQQENIP